LNYSLDDTQPNPAVSMPHMVTMDDDEGSGPGCVVWGLVGVFMLAGSLFVVLMAGLAGWNDGYRVAIGNATATSAQEILTQCNLIPNDLAQNAFGLAQVRVNSLMQSPQGAECVATLAPQMTAVYSSAMQTLTPAATATAEPTATPALVVDASPSPDAPPAPTSSSGFDLGGLLAEAQADVNAGEFLRAIDTLDAISAVDPTFQKSQVDQLLFRALTSEATRQFRGGGNLAQAIALTSRAEAYGDVGELNYERFIAELWLQAQAYSGVNYPRAIQLLNRIVFEQRLPNYRNAQQQLVNQYIAYGDALALGGDPCNAVQQFDQAVRISNSQTANTKRANAQAACTALQTAPTLDPFAPTPDPAASGGSSGSGTAPIGQRP
jgi:tetratricopeptide (TPR) repeat protein